MVYMNIIRSYLHAREVPHVPHLEDAARVSGDDLWRVRYHLHAAQGRVMPVEAEDEVFHVSVVV